MWSEYFVPSVLWHCWLGGRKGIRPVKNLSGGILAWLSVCSKMQTCIWPSWCHCHSLSLASVKSRLVLPFWYWLTWVVPEKGQLNGCVCVCVCVWSEYFCLKTGASKRVSVSNNLGLYHNRKANSVHPKIYKNDGSNNLYNIYITLFVLHFITSDWWREDLLLLLHREKQVMLSHQTSAYIRKHFIGLREKLQFNRCGGCDMALATTTVATC